MNENDNIFDISDYSGYFDSSSTEVVEIPVDGSAVDSGTEPPETDVPPPETDEALPPADADVKSDESTAPETPVITEESGQAVISEIIDYTKQFEDVNTHLNNIEAISIVVLVSIGILIGINVLKVLLDRLWR